MQSAWFVVVLKMRTILFRCQVKPKHLQNLKLDAPSLSKTAQIGSIERKQTSYDVWTLGDEPSDTIGAEEMKTLTCLLPRKKKGTKFYAGT